MFEDLFPGSLYLTVVLETLQFVTSLFVVAKLDSAFWRFEPIETMLAKLPALAYIQERFNMRIAYCRDPIF
ncbi:MAG: hypothetical protein E3J45_04375 [Candidatus Zixiibacteriota bacterium]|nr:MAG: hypothetical protein E3J45_04375 [candidate division Zixibacteria bacterium]